MWYKVDRWLVKLCGYLQPAVDLTALNSLDFRLGRLYLYWGLQPLSSTRLTRLNS